jgi:hypothetical protein
LPLTNYLRLADGELEALTTHLLNEDRESELSTALDLPGVRTSDVDELDGDVTNEFAVETVLDHTSGELVALDLADHRRGVGSDGHRDGRVVNRDGRQRTNIVRVGEGLTNGDVLETGDGDDVTGASGLGGEAVKRLGDEELGHLGVEDGSIVLDPGNGLALFDGAVEDTQEGEAAEEGGRVKVGDVSLERVLVVEGRRGNVLEDRVEERLEVSVVGQGAVFRLVPARGTVTARSVNNGNVKNGVEVEVGVVVCHVGCEAEEQVLALGDNLVDTRVRTVGLVDEQDDGELGLEGLAENEAGLRQRAL